VADIVEIIQPSGKLDAEKLTLLNTEIVDFLARGVKLILLDFQDVTHIQVDCVEYLKEIVFKVQSHEGKFYCCSLNDQVKNVLETSQTKNFFYLLTSRQEFEEKILSSGSSSW